VYTRVRTQVRVQETGVTGVTVLQNPESLATTGIFCNTPLVISVLQAVLQRFC